MDARQALASSLASQPALGPDPERTHDADPDDAVVAARIRTGDVAAFEVLFHRYYPGLRAFVLGYVESAAIADECVQDVLFRVWEQRERWHVHHDVRRYLYGAARNAALNVLRAQRVTSRWEARAVYDASASGMGQGPAPAEDDVRDRELAVALAEAIGRLPARRRETFLLRWQHHLSNAAIAEVMGVSLKNVERQLMHALGTLRDELSRFF